LGTVRARGAISVHVDTRQKERERERGREGERERERLIESQVLSARGERYPQLYKNKGV